MENTLVFDSTTKHTHTVIFLHGRGDTVRNFVRALAYWVDSDGQPLPQAFQSFRWVFPQAKNLETAHRPGMTQPQWFDVWSAADFSEREDLQIAGLRHSVSDIRDVLTSEAALLNNRWDHLLLAGISQGAATSIHTLINLSLPTEVTGQRQLGAFLGFSCRLPFTGRSLADTRKVLDLENVPESDEVVRNTPMLLEHCADDPLVLIEHGRDLRESLRAFGANVLWKEYPKGGHWFKTPEGMDDVVRFLNEQVLAKHTELE